MARALIDQGFTRVRPLAGGLEAWVAAGLPVETDEEAARMPQEVFPIGS